MRILTGARRQLGFAMVAAAGLAAACGDEDPAGAGPAPTAVTVPLGELHDALYPTLTDSVLAKPNDFVVADDRIWVAETNVSRVTVLTEDFELVRRIGRRGEGPGELMSPFTLRVRDGVVSVGDNGTGRFELFDTSGVSLGSYPTTGGQEHALLGPDRLVAVDLDPSTLGTLIGPAGAKPFGSSPNGEGGARGPIPYNQMHAGRLDGEPVVLLIPESTGALMILDLDGDVVETRKLPANILAELEDHQEQLAEMFGGALVGSSMVKGVGVSPDGRFVTVASMAESAPVMIHDLDGRRLILVDVSEHLQAAKVQSARVAVFDEGLLYVLSGGSMFAFELELPD